jgi:4-hydroxy-tetrahydrodipicolinate synthase
LDLPRLRWLIDWLIEQRVHGIFVLGTTGEFYALDDKEKQSVVATAVEHVAGRLPVFVGTGAESTREVIRLTKMAEQEKADGVSVITPYFLKPTQTELMSHFRRVAESTSLPVVLYNNPATCGGVSIDPASCGQLSELPNIVGIKDSSGDLQNTIEILRCTPRDRFSVLNGRDTLIFSAFMAGAQGAIPASCNIAPRLCVGIYESFQAGDYQQAQDYQSRLHAIRTALTLGTGNGAVKEAMALLGRPMGPNRLPISPLSDDKRQVLKGVLDRAGVTV